MLKHYKIGVSVDYGKLLHVVAESDSEAEEIASYLIQKHFENRSAISILRKSNVMYRTTYSGDLPD